MPAPGGILALDLSGICGWAYGRLTDNAPICGTWRLAPGGIGPLVASFENALEDAISMHSPGLIFVEAPMPATALSNSQTWRQQLGLAASAEAAAWRCGVRYREQSATTVRSQILGTTRHPPGGNIKDVVMAWCHKQGWQPVDHNAGDACVLFEFARREQQKARAA